MAAAFGERLLAEVREERLDEVSAVCVVLYAMLTGTGFTGRKEYMLCWL